MTIDNIVFKGDFSIKRSLLLEIMLINENENYTPNELYDKVEYLKTSGLFYSVESEYDDSTQNFVITLQEKTTINGFVSFNQSKDLSNISFGIQERNLFDRYILLGSYFQSLDGYFSSTFWIEYPRIIKNTDLLLSVYRHNDPDFLYIDEIRYKVQIKREGYKAGFRYHLSEKLDFQAEFERFDETYRFNKDFYLSQFQSSEFTFEKYGYHFSINYNDVSQYFHQVHGFKISNFYKFYNHDYEPNYHYNLTTSSYFYNHEHLTSASRLMIGLSAQSNFLYPFTTDGFNTIRSSRFHELRGQHAFIFNQEIRYLTYDHPNFYVQSVAFYDAAYMRVSDKNDFNAMKSDHSSLYALGLGLRIELKKWYNAIMRIDFPYHNGEFSALFGIGQFF
jgi:hypothetical protein